MTMASSDESLHVLLLPFPLQGHINPLLQFGKRLASYSGVRCTLAVSRFIFNSTRPTPSSVRMAVYSDGCDNGGPDEAGGLDVPYLKSLESAGSESLDELLLQEAERGRPVHVVVYDATMPRALVGVARRRGATCASFLTQMCGVDVVYAHAWDGLIPPPPLQPDEVPEFTGLSTQLKLADLPTFLADTNHPPCIREALTSQFLGLDTADHVLVNSFDGLEPQEASYLASRWGVRTVGPTVPSVYLDNRIPGDVSYSLHLQAPITKDIKTWLDSHTACSVLYIAFGSMASLGPEHLAEIAEGLYNSSKPFLWVVRATETSKLPDNFAEKVKARGLIVPWCQQLEVLAHPSVGCFMTHCGWNSTLEGLSAGVPMVAMPYWSDQPTNAKYIQDVWCVGIRMTPDAKGVVRRDEVERCVREVMDGERSKEFKRKAIDWSYMAKKAMSKGGTSDINISNFLFKCRRRK